MDVDVALADVPGCRTGGIGTEYIVRVHEIPSGLVVGKILLGPASDCPNLTVKRTPTPPGGLQSKIGAYRALFFYEHYITASPTSTLLLGSDELLLGGIGHEQIPPRLLLCI